MTDERKSTGGRTARSARGPARVLCPRCGELTAWSGNPHRPFCSERCRLIDLGAWATEDYKISSPAPPKEPEGQ